MTTTYDFIPEGDTIVADNRPLLGSSLARHLVWTTSRRGLRTLFADGVMVGWLRRTAKGYVVTVCGDTLADDERFLFPLSGSGFAAAVARLLAN